MCLINDLLHPANFPPHLKYYKHSNMTRKFVGLASGKIVTSEKLQ